MSDYFPNVKVEALVIKYVEDGCTDIKLRNEIMEWAVVLIKQVIGTFNLAKISATKRHNWEDELLNVAWIQIEKTLYKFDSSPGHSPLFSMWTQIAHTVALAHLKYEKRDSIGRPALKKYQLKTRRTLSPLVLRRFCEEAREICKSDIDHLKCIDALEKLASKRDDLDRNLVAQLVKATGFGRPKVKRFLRDIRLRAGSFSDSPLNMDREELGSQESAGDESI